MNLLFCLLQLFFHFGETSAQAQVYLLHSEAPGGQVRTEVVPVADCETIIRGTFFPQNTIKAGLRSLEKINQPKQKTNTACLEEVLDGWDISFPDERYNPVKLNNRKVKYELADEALSRELECFNPFPPESMESTSYAREKAQCDGKWLAKEEAEALYQKQKTLQKEGQLLTKTSVLFEAASLRELNKEISQILSQVRCPKFFATGADQQAAAEKLQPECAGKWIATNELAEKNERYNFLIKKKLEEIDRLAAAYRYRAAEKMDATIPPPSDYFYDRKDQLVPILAKLACVDDYSSSGHYRSWNSNPENCAKNSVSESDIPALLEELAKSLPEINEAAKEVSKENQLRNRDQQEAKLKERKNYAEFYKIRRILTYFEFASKRGEDNVKKICQQYHAMQKRDHQYSQTPHGMLGIATPAPFGSPKGWRLAREYGMSEAELGSIRGYAGDFYKEINTALWENPAKLPASLKYVKATLDSGLDKLPAFGSLPLIRYATLPDGVLKQHQVGSIVKYDAYTSTSKNSDWVWEGKHRFVIFGAKNGKDISLINANEEEVLFKAGTRFKVLAREPRPNEKDGIDFVLAEVDEKGRILETSSVNLNEHPL